MTDLPTLLGGDGPSDGTGGMGMLGDPRMMAVLGLLQGYGRARAPSRMPVNNSMVLGDIAGGLSQGIQAGQQTRLVNQEAEQRQLGNAMTRARLNDIATRHPDWFGAPTAGGGGTAAPTMSGVTGGGEPSAPGGALGGGGPAPTLMGGPSMAGAPAAMPPPPGANAAAAPPMLLGNAGSGNNGLPTTAQDAADYLFLHPEMKDIVGKGFAGPTDVERSLTAAGVTKDSPLGQLILRTGMWKASGAPMSEGGARAGTPYMERNPLTGAMEQKYYVPPAVAGSGVTIGANGVPSYYEAPGGTSAVQRHSTAEAAGPATFRPETYYGPGGVEFRGTALQAPDIFAGKYGPIGGAPAPAAPAASAPPASSFVVPQVGAALGAPGPRVESAGGDYLRMAPSGSPASSPTPGASAVAPAASPGAAATSPLSQVKVPIQTPMGPKELGDLSLNDLFPNGQGIPLPPSPPKGMGYGAPTDQQKKRQDEDAQLVATYTKEASENPKVYQDLTHLSDVLKRGLNTNKVAPLWTDLANVAQGMGLESLIPKNYDPNDSAAFDKAATDLVFAAVKKLAGQVRVAEIEGYKQANPNKTIPRAANFNVVNDVLALSKVQDQRADLANRYLTQYPGAPISAFNTAFDKMAPLDQITEHMKDQLRGSGWTFPGDKGTPSNPNTPFDAKTLPADVQQKADAIRKNYQMGAFGNAGSDEAKAKAAEQLKALGFPD